MIVITDLTKIPELPVSVQPLVDEIDAIAVAAGLQNSTLIAIIEASDTEAAVTQGLGWNPLHNPIDGIRFDQQGFYPYWAWLEQEAGWYRLIHTIGNDGFAYELLIEAAGDGPFHGMCREAQGML